MSAPNTLPKPGTAGFTISKTPSAADAPKARGGRPKDPNAKVTLQITLRPGDWEYIRLWSLKSYNDPDNDSKRVERVLARLRDHVPYGPGKSFHVHDPAQATKPRRTPAIAREAKRRGIETAELENEMWALYKAQQKAREE